MRFRRRSYGRRRVRTGGYGRRRAPLRRRIGYRM